MYSMISKKKIIRAFLQMLLVLAVLHFVILVIHTVMTGDMAILNVFRIIEVDLFYSFDPAGIQSLVLSAVVIAGMYVSIYVYRS